MRTTVENAAADFIGWRVAEMRLRKERNAIECWRERDGEAPCWKPRYDGNGDALHAPRAEWCADCQRRQGIQDARRAAGRLRGAALRKLARAVLASTPPGRPGATKEIET